jgi:hypothetical protein
MARPQSELTVVRMFKLTLSPQANKSKRATHVVLWALAINALVFSPLGDQGFPAMVLFGPPITGFVAARRRADVQVVAAAWALSGLSWLVLDWAIHDEDQIFHLVLAFLMAALTFLGGRLGRFGSAGGHARPRAI